MLPRSIGFLDKEGNEKRVPLKEGKRPTGYTAAADRWAKLFRQFLDDNLNK